MTHSDSPKTFRFLDLDSYYNNRLIGSTAALSSLCDTTKEGLIDFDYTRQLPSLATYHRYSIPLENGPGRPVAGAQSSFQGFGRKAVLSGCKVPCGFKPSRQWCPRFFKNRTSRHGCLMTACGTDQTATRLAPRLRTSHAFRATKAFWPPQVLQVVCTRAVVRKMLHEFAVSVWKIVSCCHMGQNNTGGANRLPPF